MARPFGIALTGGIGSGKSTVSSIFGKFGIDIIDTDEISRELTARNGPAIGKILEAFGKDYIEEGSLNRGKMRKLVFSDESSKKKLEAILHPLIREEVEKRIASVKSPYYVIVVPLLFETGHYSDLADRILVVDCSESLQIARTTARSKLTRDEVLAIMKNQVARPVRLAGASDVVTNEGGPEVLEMAVAGLHRKYLMEC
ncbi:MAG: dephospho-CoA kinase [Burkholderiales bacterium]